MNTPQQPLVSDIAREAELLPVSQEAREAAAKHTRGRFENDRAVRSMIAGERDHEPLVQEFASFEATIRAQAGEADSPTCREHGNPIGEYLPKDCEPTPQAAAERIIAYLDWQGSYVGEFGPPMYNADLRILADAAKASTPADLRELALDLHTLVGRWEPMETAPKDGTLVELVVDYSDGGGPLHDARLSPTIGFNNLSNTAEDRWQFAGWSWEQDCFCEGDGTPIAWRPSRLNAYDEGLPPMPPRALKGGA